MQFNDRVVITVNQDGVIYYLSVTGDLLPYRCRLCVMPYQAAVKRAARLRARYKDVIIKKI